MHSISTFSTSQRPDLWTTAALAQFVADLGDIPVATDPGTIKLKSRDFFWFSPILKPLLDDKRAFAIVRPRDRADLIKVVALAAKRRIALTTRGGGTGNYGQCVPLDGGIVLDMTGLDSILETRPGLVKVEAGKVMLEIDRELKPSAGSCGFSHRRAPLRPLAASSVVELPVQGPSPGARSEMRAPCRA